MILPTHTGGDDRGLYAGEHGGAGRKQGAEHGNDQYADPFETEIIPENEKPPLAKRAGRAVGHTASPTLQRLFSPVPYDPQGVFCTPYPHPPLQASLLPSSLPGMARRNGPVQMHQRMESLTQRKERRSRAGQGSMKRRRNAWRKLKESWKKQKKGFRPVPIYACKKSMTVRPVR